MTGIAPRRVTVDGVPALVVVPEQATGPVALWMSHLGGSKEQTTDALVALATAGSPSISFDAVEHGERATLEPFALLDRVMGDFHARMWPILALTAIDAMRVLDWAVAELAVDDDAVVAGGVSMGGDIAVTLAGIDPRVGRVAGLMSTPDWSRPGMHLVDDPSRLLDQGAGDTYSNWLRDQLDPMLHVDRYRRPVEILFECGDLDSHVPPENAEEFREMLGPVDGARVQVHRNAGLDHLAGCRDAGALASCLDFLTRRP